MKRPDGTWLARLVVAIAMMISCVLVPATPTLAHAPVQHAEAADDHGHSHDLDDIEVGPSGGHKHTHNSADHMHDVPGLPPTMDANIRRVGPDRAAVLHQDVPANTPSTLDRPPKLIRNA